jgi:predicted phage baseplate assembly protein
MPLPLPNLDSRRWTDLVEEGRALIPRYAPSWTDHNIHDPGITLMELLAWMVEQDIYRVNRVPNRHRLKFLALTGFAPRPPQPAQTTLTFTLAPGEPALTLPAGLTCATGLTRLKKRVFRTVADVVVVPATVESIQTETSGSFTDRTRLWRDGHPFALMGDDPVPGDAVYFGFDTALPVGVKCNLWFWWQGDRVGSLERGRIGAEAREANEACRPPRPRARGCPGSDESPSTVIESPRHHTVDTVWEYFDGNAWQPIEVEDDTVGMSLDGGVTVMVPGMMTTSTVGVVSGAHFYLRWRLIEGPPDSAPVLSRMAINSVTAVQSSPSRSSLSIAPGVVPPVGGEPVVGEQKQLDLKLNAAGEIVGLAVTSIEGAPEALILEYQPATPTETGFLTFTLHLAGEGDGHPKQRITLKDAPIAYGRAAVWTTLSDELVVWSQRADLDASSRAEAHFALDGSNGVIEFGDGEKGRVPQKNAQILAKFQRTDGATGNVPAQSNWYLEGADDLLNTALLGVDVASASAKLSGIENLVAAGAGEDAETIAHASGRAAEFLWAHERLVELSNFNRCDTLDQQDRELVMALAAPPRATTLLDYERLALEVPGTKLERVRAWAGIDPAHPCLSAPGTVTVCVVPSLPAGRPEPTPGLLAAVHRYLFRRRIIGTRLQVTGPGYVEVRVQATVQVKDGVNAARVQADIVEALDRFLDPLTGGPNERGWPFGRDVYRSEILQLIDGVTGVDHVLALALLADNSEPQCHNLCVMPIGLVTAGTHHIDIVV